MLIAIYQLITVSSGLNEHDINKEIPNRLDSPEDRYGEIRKHETRKTKEKQSVSLTKPILYQYSIGNTKTLTTIGQSFTFDPGNFQERNAIAE